MPRRSRGKSRRHKKRRSSNKIHSVIIRGPSAFPDRVFVRLRYINSYRLAFAGLNLATFSGNALSRPDISEPSQLPRGLIEWMNIYDLVKCHKSNISVQALNADVFSPCDVAVLPHGEVAPVILDTEDAREQPYCKSKRCGSRNGGGAVVSVRNSMKTKTLYGTKFINDTYAGTLTAPPSQQWFWAVYLQHLTDDVGEVTMDISVTVTYFVEFYNRKYIPRSEAPLIEPVR